MREKLITTLKEYKETYSSRLENHISKYEDYDELHFINNELYLYQNCFTTVNVSERRIMEYNSDFEGYRNYYLNDFEFDEINNEESTGSENYTVKDLIKNESKFLTDGYDLEICNQLTISFLKIKSFLESKLLELESNEQKEIHLDKTLNWIGTQTDLIELIKALIENGNIKVKKGEQGKTIEVISNFFNFPINNPNKLIADLKIRNTESETLFLDKLKKTLFDYITRENKK
jgi:hypothetical protein